ncbi:MAG: hypothetical protein KDA20_12880 [Phycisphaerales bacterium]|nr:hypothetical protein [Phycisphaerales bacterium]
MAHAEMQVEVGTLDATESQLWRIACALTGDRAAATSALCTVLANAERPGRGGGRAPVGAVRLTRAIAMHTRGAQPEATPPFDGQMHAQAAALWKAMHALPRAARIAWIIAHVRSEPLAQEDGVFVMGASAGAFAEALESAEQLLGSAASPEAKAGLLEALAPTEADGVGAALGAMRASARRRWRRTSALLLLAFIAFVIVFGSTMLDLVGRDAKDARQREAFDRAERDFSNPMPPSERSTP